MAFNRIPKCPHRAGLVTVRLHALEGTLDVTARVKLQNKRHNILSTRLFCISSPVAGSQCLSNLSLADLYSIKLLADPPPQIIWPNLPIPQRSVSAFRVICTGVVYINCLSILLFAAPVAQCPSWKRRQKDPGGGLYAKKEAPPPKFSWRTRVFKAQLCQARPPICQEIWRGSPAGRIFA